MALAVVDRAKQAFERTRERTPVLDLILRIQGHYSRVGASQQAGAITYFGFLSFFPLLALAVFVVGLISGIWPQAEDGMTSALNQLIPGLIGSGNGQISLDDVQRFSGLAGVVGLLGVAYAGTGWVDALRTALFTVFEIPAEEKPGFLKAKGLDLIALSVIGAVLFVSVVGAQTLTSFSSDVVDWLGFGSPIVLGVLSYLISWAVSTLLFFALFRLVGQPPVPGRSLWEASLIGAFLFEVMKLVSFLILSSVKGSPAFQAFGVALVLLVWINYFTRVTFYAASYACEIRPVEPERTSDTPLPAP